MKSENKYWKVKCSRHLETIFETQIHVNDISENGLKALIQTLMSKYALSDDEIVRQHLKKSTKKAKQYVEIVRTNEVINGRLRITFRTQIADTYIEADFEREKDELA